MAVCHALEGLEAGNDQDCLLFFALLGYATRDALRKRATGTIKRISQIWYIGTHYKGRLTGTRYANDQLYRCADSGATIAEIAA